MSWKSIFQDIRSAVDWVHFDVSKIFLAKLFFLNEFKSGDMKKIILENLDQYVEKDEVRRLVLVNVKKLL